MKKVMKKVSILEMNNLLQELKENNRFFINRLPDKNELIGRFNVYILAKRSKIILVYKDLKGNGVVRELSASLDKEFDGNSKNGAQALAILSKYYKAPQMDLEPFSKGISPWRSSKIIGKRFKNCIGYDFNSAYPYGMLQDLPDTTNMLEPGKVGKNEYSFTETGLRAAVGSYSKYRFPLMKTPFKKFIETWYNKKKTADNSADKITAKFVMNAAIGALQHHNCFLRAAIMNNFQEEIEKIFRKYRPYILSMNTDSIVSTIRIPEIENNIGDDIGQWKIEHFGDFAVHKNGYSTQWNNELPSFGAGIPKTWFKPGYDILVDDVPEINNKYLFDFKNLKIIENKEWVDYEK